MPLGLPANFTLHRRVYLFSDSAIQYVQDARRQVLCVQESFESGTDSSSQGSFSSGIYSNDSSESSESGAVSPPIVSKGSSFLPALSEQEEFGSSSHADDFGNVSDTDSDVEQETHQRVETLLRRNTAQHGSIPLVRDAAGKLVIVPQIVDYRYRPTELVHFSLYEFVCCSFRREINSKTEKKDKQSSSDTEQEDVAGVQSKQQQQSRPRRGRKKTVLYTFQKEHPLVASHAVALHRKHCISQFIKKVPPYPGKRSDPLTEAWKSRARNFAEFALVVYKPWTGPDGLPESTTWKDFCIWMHTLKAAEDILSRTRTQFVINASHNLKFMSSVSKILKQFRGSNATRWVDMPAHNRPKAWMYGDEGTLEKTLPSKNTEREAALAMQELLHIICIASQTETKKAELMKSTLQNYMKAIQIERFSSSVMSSLLGGSVPPLLNRVDCFSYGQIKIVQEQNLMKLADQQTLNQRAKRLKKFKQQSAIRRPRSPSPVMQNTADISWSPQQEKIISAVTEFLERFTDWKNGTSPPPPSLSMLIFGGPGVGKTTVLKTISVMCETALMPLLSSAATGVAAGNMRRAGTNHSKFSMPVFNRGENDSNGFLPPLSQAAINALMQEFQDSLESGTPLAIAVDECSMLSAITFGRILKRINEFEKSYFASCKVQPPRLFILVGDFYQVGPVSPSYLL